MKEQQNMDYKELIKEYKDKDPRVAEAINALESQLMAEERRYERQQEIIKIFKHDMRAPLMTMVASANPRKWQTLTEEKKDKRIPVMYSSAQVAEDRLELLDLTEISKERLQEYSKYIAIAELAKTHISSIENHLDRIQIGFQFKSSGKMGLPLQVYAHKAAMGSIIENLIGGGLNYAPKKSKIKLGIKEKLGSLEIMAENKYTNSERIRDIAGEARGLGLPFMKEITTVMGGAMETYDSQRINGEYDECAKFGYKGRMQKHPRVKTFGIKLTIPMNSLKKPEPSPNKSNKN